MPKHFRSEHDLNLEVKMCVKFKAQNKYKENRILGSEIILLLYPLKMLQKMCAEYFDASSPSYGALDLIKDINPHYYFHY